MYMLMSESNFDIAALMAKPVWQMSGEEFVQLADYALSSKPSGTSSEPLYVYGIQALGAYIGCCPSTIYELKKNGVLTPAIVSQVGKKIVFNAALARELAEKYKREKRGEGQL